MRSRACLISGPESSNLQRTYDRTGFLSRPQHGQCRLCGADSCAIARCDHRTRQIWPPTDIACELIPPRLVLHAPAADGPGLDQSEDDVLDKKADEDNREQSGKDLRNVEQVFRFKYVPA